MLRDQSSTCFCVGHWHVHVHVKTIDMTSITIKANGQMAKSILWTSKKYCREIILIIWTYNKCIKGWQNVDKLNAIYKQVIHRVGLSV